MPWDGELHGLTWNTAAQSVQRRERLDGSVDWVSVMEKATSGDNVYWTDGGARWDDGIEHLKSVYQISFGYEGGHAPGGAK
jgi:hypothetical protein